MSSETAPAERPLQPLLPDPRLDVLLASRLRRLAGRASSQLQVLPATEVAVARRLNGPLSRQAWGHEAVPREARDQCCRLGYVSVVGKKKTTCIPSLGHYLTSSNRILRPQLLLHSSGPA